jgi:hypothetical protein
LLFPEIIERREAISSTEQSKIPPTNLPISSTDVPISSKNGEFPSTNLPISSTASLNLPCTSKNFHRLSTELGKLNSVEKISNFLIEETKSRKCDRKKSLTKKLDQSDWRSLREEVKKLIENSKNEKKFVKNLRQKITFWILFPNLKGDKPENWNKILEILIKS